MAPPTLTTVVYPEQVVSLSQYSCVSLVELADGTVGERWWCGRSQIMEEGKDEEAKIGGRGVGGGR